MIKPSSFISALTLVAFVQSNIIGVWASPVTSPKLTIPAEAPTQAPSLSTLYLGADPYSQALLRLQYDAEDKSLEWQLLNNGYVLSSQSHRLPENTQTVDNGLVFNGDQMVVAGRTTEQRWFIRALNSQGEYQWQQQGEGRIYDLAFSDDGQMLYAVGVSQKQPLLLAVNTMNGVIEFHTDAETTFDDDSGGIYKQVVVTSDKEVVVARHWEDSGQLQYIKWQAVADPDSGEYVWETVSGFCRDCDRTGVKSVALKNDREQERFYSIASDGRQLEFSIKDVVNGASVATQAIPVEMGSGIWDGVLRISEIPRFSEFVSRVGSNLILTSDNCKIHLEHQDVKAGLFFNLCGTELNHVSARRLLTINDTTTVGSDECEDRHFMNLEWLVGVITVVAALGLLYSGYRFVVHAWNKRDERIERDKDKVEEKRLARKKFINNLDKFNPLSNIPLHPGAPGESSVLPVSGVMPVKVQESLAFRKLQPTGIVIHDDQDLLSLFSSIHEGHQDRAEELLAYSPSLIDATDNEGATVLHLAASSGHNSMIETLLILGADTEATTEQGYLPLHLAAMIGEKKATALLLNWMPQLSPDVVAELFHIAAIHGHLDVLKLLHRRNMDDEIQMSKLIGRQYLTQFRNGVYHATGFGFIKKAMLPDGLGANGLSILHEAAMNNHLAVVEYIVEEALVPVNAGDEHGNSALHIAASNGNYHIVEYLVESGSDINAQNNQGYTPLHSAIVKRNRQVVEYLAGLESMDMKKTSVNGDTPLHLACEYEMSSELVGKGDANMRRKDGKTPLHLAAYSGNALAITNLGLSLKAGAFIKFDTKDDHGNTALHIAAMNGHYEFSRQLLVRHENPEKALQVTNNAKLKPAELAASINVREMLETFGGKTVTHQKSRDSEANYERGHRDTSAPIAMPSSKEPELHEKAAYGLTVEVVELLKERRASISDQNSYGATALHVSSKNGHLALARELIKLGADIHSKRQQKATPLHDAAVNGHVDLVVLLIENSAGINDVMDDGASALHLASREGYTEVIEQLISHGAEKNIRNKEKDTPLHLAVERDQLSTAHTLVKLGAEVGLKNDKGDTPLHLAVRKKNREMTELFIGDDASVNTQNLDGNTPLHVAANGGEHELTKLLIEKGAATNVVNKKGKSPLVLAARGRHIEVANTLRTAHRLQTRAATLKSQQTKMPSATSAPESVQLTTQAEIHPQPPQETTTPAAVPPATPEMPKLELAVPLDPHQEPEAQNIPNHLPGSSHSSSMESMPPLVPLQLGQRSSESPMTSPEVISISEASPSPLNPASEAHSPLGVSDSDLRREPEEHKPTTSPEQDLLPAQPSPVPALKSHISATGSETDPNILDQSLPTHRALVQDVTHSIFIPELTLPEIVSAPEPEGITTESIPEQTETQQISPETTQPGQVAIPMEPANDIDELEDTDTEKTSAL